MVDSKIKLLLDKAKVLYICEILAMISNACHDITMSQ